MKTEGRFSEIAEIAAVFFLVVGCYVVLRPFMAAVAWAAILCYSTWPLYSFLERLLKQRRTLTASLMTGFITLLIIVPLVVVGVMLLDNIKYVVAMAHDLFKNGAPDAPAWVKNVPFVGPIIENYWGDLAHNGEAMVEALKQILSRWQGWFVQWGLELGHGIFQLTLSVFISFFFYRNGVLVVEKVQEVARKISGDRMQHVLHLIGATIKGVVYGILGTAVLHAVLAGLGFWAIQLPLPLLWGFVMFFLSLVPGGPLLLWGPIFAWLIYKGSIGWVVALAIWGLFITVIDHILKPYLISRGSNLPFVMVFLGVFGGVIAFGFIGVFIGPTLLAVGYSLAQDWVGSRLRGGTHYGVAEAGLRSRPEREPRPGSAKDKEGHA